MTRILVAGAAGFVGSHAVEHLQANTDWEIVGLASFRHRGDPVRVGSFDDRVLLLHADLTAPVGARLRHHIGEIDYIWNFAAESHVDRSIAEPRPFVENNVSLAITMLELARDLGVKGYYQVSTDEVYGPAEGGRLHREWDPIIPSNPYAASKAAQEALATAWWRTYGVPVVIANGMNMIGERQDAEKFVPMCIRNINAGKVVTIHGRPGAIGSRFYLHARNYADALLFLTRTIEPARYPDADRPDRYHIVGELELDNLTLALTLAEILHKPLRYELVDFHAARPGHDRRYALDGAKMAGIGWKPPVPLLESLERVVAWTLAHPEWLA